MGILDLSHVDPASVPGWLDNLLQAQPGPSQGFADQPQPANVGSGMANAAPAFANATPALASGGGAAPALTSGVGTAPVNPFAALFGNPAQSPSPATPGIGDRLGAAFMNFANARGLLPALAGAASGLATGQRNDRASLLQAQLGAAAQALAGAGVPPALAQAAALNPDVMRAIAPQLVRQAMPAAGAPAGAAQPTLTQLLAEMRQRGMIK